MLYESPNIIVGDKGSMDGFKLKPKAVCLVNNYIITGPYPRKGDVHFFTDGQHTIVPHV